MTTWVKRLLAWYRSFRRDLPWRRTSDPYLIWLSEVMLQQTQVDTVIPYFRRFLASFPTVNDLAAADIQAVLKQWEGLGYYSRARNLHKAARQIIHDRNGEMPETFDELRSLPGFGPYTAAAVGSIAFDLSEPVVDGNVLRVFTRFWGIADDIRRPIVRNKIRDRLRPFIKETSPGDFNQAMMELGALICRPTKPDCSACPLRKDCVANGEDRVEELPVKTTKAPTPHYEIAVGVIHRKGRILIAKRPQESMLGGLWEFPGGKREPDETLDVAVVREIMEETGLKAIVGEKIITLRHTYSHFSITLTAFACRAEPGKAIPHAADELKWVRPSDLDSYPFPSANKKIIQAILNS